MTHSSEAWTGLPAYRQPLRDRIWYGSPFYEIRQWLEQLWFAHHNASMLADMEYLGCVLNHTTRGMSKAYYTWEAMQAEINSFQREQYDDAYREGQNDKAEELAAAHDARVTELLEANNRYQQEARDARSEHAVCRQNFHTMQIAANELRKRAEAAERALAGAKNESRSVPITRHDDGTYTVHDMGQ